MPLQTNDDVITTQFPMTTVEQLGLLKMDFLGLRTLTVINDALDHGAAGRRRRTLTCEEIPMDDTACTYAMLGRGDTDGVFQLESAGMRRVADGSAAGESWRISSPSSRSTVPAPWNPSRAIIAGKNEPVSVRYSIALRFWNTSSM